MARRIDFDDDDDFEVLCDLSPSNIQQTYESINGDDSFEIVPCENKFCTLINTNFAVSTETIPIKVNNQMTHAVKPTVRTNFTVSTEEAPIQANTQMIHEVKRTVITNFAVSTEETPIEVNNQMIHEVTPTVLTDFADATKEAPIEANTQMTHEVKPTVLTIFAVSTKETPIEVNNQIVHELKPSVLTNSEEHPVRYGSAANIPYTDSFDFNSILTTKPIIPAASNLMDLLRDDTVQRRPSFNNNLVDLVLNHSRDHETLVQLAKQARKNFLDAIHLD